MYVVRLAFFNGDDDTDLEFIAYHNQRTTKYYDKVTDSESDDYGHYLAAAVSTDYPLKNINETHATPVFVNLDDDTELELVVGGDTPRGASGGLLKYFDKNSSGNYVEKTGEHNPFSSLTLPLKPLPSFVDKDGDG